MMWGRKQLQEITSPKFFLIPLSLLLLLHPLCPNTFSAPLLILLAVLLLLLHLVASSSASRLPPGPPSLPWLGNLTNLDPVAPYETLTKLIPKYGKVIIYMRTYTLPDSGVHSASWKGSHCCSCRHNHSQGPFGQVPHHPLDLLHTLASPCSWSTLSPCSLMNSS